MTTINWGLQPGDVGFSTIGGTTGALVNIGQAILRDSCRYTHAYIYVGNGKVLEAMPSGSRIVYGADREGPWYRLPLTSTERSKVVYSGDLEGIPYSFMDYAALAWWEWKLPGRNRLRNYVSSSNRMICSQLVDYTLCRVGYHLFQDGRLHQDVTPGDLFYACAGQGQLVER